MSKSGYLRDGQIDLNVGLKIYLDDAHACVGLRLSTLDVVDCRAQRSLTDSHDPLRRTICVQAVVSPDNADNWNIDLGENARRRSHNRGTAEDKDQQGNNDDE